MSLLTNLVSYWKLDGNSNDAVGSNNGTDTSITYGTSYGKINQGALFNGTSSKIQIATQFTDTYGTLNVWFRTTASGTNEIYSQSMTVGDGYRIQFEINSGKVYFMVYASTAIQVQVSTNSTYNDSNWHMATYTVSSSGNTIYVDNTTPALTYANGNNTITTWFSAVSGNTNTNSFGQLNINGTIYNHFNGDIDEVGIWSRALSSTEVSQLYNGGLGKQYPFYVAYTLTAAYTAYTLTTISTAFKKGWKLTGSATAYALTMIGSALTKGLHLIGSVTIFTLTSIGAIFIKALKLTSGVTSFVLTGISTNLLRPIRNLIASVSSFTLTGISATLLKAKMLIASVTNYTLTGINTNFLRPIRNLIASVSAFAVSGVNVSLSRLIELIASATNYTLTGINTTFNRLINLIGTVTSFSLTGINITLQRLIILVGSVANYTLTGININLLKPIRNLVASVSNFTLTGMSIIFGGGGNWTWTHRIKPTTSWTNRIKPTTIWTKRTKP